MCYIVLFIEWIYFYKAFWVAIAVFKLLFYFLKFEVYYNRYEMCYYTLDIAVKILLDDWSQSLDGNLTDTDYLFVLSDCFLTLFYYR